MRGLVFVCLLAGCPGSLDTAALGDDKNGSDPVPNECVSDADCTLAGAKCCDCPTYATTKVDPAASACGGVTCPMSTCPDNVAASCSNNQCVLACKPLACNLSCPDGFVLDATGCEECACVAVDARACSVDSDCARVRADCCGCALGGVDTAVPVDDVAIHDASLACPTNPSCPGTDTCAPDLAARCVSGSCALVPPLPVGACGRPDLPACAGTCMLNVDVAATEQGVGVCM